MESAEVINSALIMAVMVLFFYSWSLKFDLSKLDEELYRVKNELRGEMRKGDESLREEIRKSKWKSGA